MRFGSTPKTGERTHLCFSVLVTRVISVQVGLVAWAVVSLIKQPKASEYATTAHVPLAQNARAPLPIRKEQGRQYVSSDLFRLSQRPPRQRDGSAQRT